MKFLNVFFKSSLILVVACDYRTEREEFIKCEESKMTGGSLSLSEDEKRINDVLMRTKLKELDEGFANPRDFPPARHIFDAVEKIQASEVFKFIKSLPKGGLLHSHYLALASTDFIFNLTYSENLYACVVQSKLTFRFLQEPVNDFSCEWRSMDVLRNNSDDIDDFVKAQLTLYQVGYKDAYEDINAVWSRFEDIFKTLIGLLTYKPVFQRCFYQILQELYDDNVMYLEVRDPLSTLYDLNGTVYEPLVAAALCEETIKLFMQTHEDFFGARLIYSPNRNTEDISQHVETVLLIKKHFPNLLAGFDLVGQEDRGRPLITVIDQLLKLKGKVQFFFHAGETNWYGTSTDFNVIDAVLLGSVRIGHGYSLLKHPDVLQTVKDKKIAIEISPISNQVLMLVGDTRNHPGSYFLANDFPVVVCSDDPGAWGIKGLSYDWYVAFMGMASRNADLRLLKQLAINSLEYSSLSEKSSARAKWEVKWNAFIDQKLMGFGCGHNRLTDIKPIPGKD